MTLILTPPCFNGIYVKNDRCHSKNDKTRKMKRKEPENETNESEDFVTQDYWNHRDFNRTFRTDYIIDSSYELAEREKGHLCPIPVFAQDKTAKECIDYLIRTGKMELGKLDEITGGKKKFTTSGYQTFQNYYLGLRKGSRFFYETVLPDIPCHLYIDSEIYHKENPDLSVREIRARFENEILFLLHKLGYIETESDCEFIVLDSSNQKKFSKHYIIKIQGKCFRNNYHCGAFMRRLHTHLIEKYGPIEQNEFFSWGEGETDFVYDPIKHNRVFMADLGVYTSARQFRLYGSSKEAAPERVLLLEDQTGDDVIPEKFLSTIIQRVPVGSKILDCTEVDGGEPVSTSDRRFFLGEHVKRQRTTGTKSVVGSAPVFNRKDPNVITSNFPAICGKILDFIDKQLPEGRADKCNFYSPTTKMLCIGTTCRMCSIRGGPHKSNHIYFVVDLHSKKYWQKCHDIDCSGRGVRQEIQDNSLIDDIDKFLLSELDDIKSRSCVEAFIFFSKFVLDIEDKQSFF